MLQSTKARDSRSKKRQALCVKLEVYAQCEKDMEVAAILSVPCVPEKVKFIRQEQAKLRKALRALDRGFTRQRAWSQGKLLY